MLWAQLKDELAAHAKAGGRHLFGPLIKHDLTQDAAGRSLAEHRELDELVAAHDRTQSLLAPNADHKDRDKAEQDAAGRIAGQEGGAMERTAKTAYGLAMAMAMAEAEGRDKVAMEQCDGVAQLSGRSR